LTPMLPPKSESRVRALTSFGDAGGPKAAWRLAESWPGPWNRAGAWPPRRIGGGRRPRATLPVGSFPPPNLGPRYRAPPATNWRPGVFFIKPSSPQRNLFASVAATPPAAPPGAVLAPAGPWRPDAIGCATPGRPSFFGHDPSYGPPRCGSRKTPPSPALLPSELAPPELDHLVWRALPLAALPLNLARRSLFHNERDVPCLAGPPNVKSGRATALQGFPPGRWLGPPLQEMEGDPDCDGGRQARLDISHSYPLPPEVFCRSL